MQTLEGKRIAFLIFDNFEQVEYTGVNELLEDEGAVTEIISPCDGPLQGLNHLDYGESFAVARTLDLVKAEDYDALVVPGGVVNADMLRADEASQELVRQFELQAKPVAMICHAPWLAVSAGVTDGVKMTSYPTLKDDITNAGGEWVDVEVVTDGVFITSRNPDDIPAFAAAITDALIHEEG